MKPAEPDPPLLSDSQRKIAGFALTLLALLGSGALLIGAFVVLGRLIAFFSGVLWPLAVAGVLALILRPLVHTLEVRFKLRRFTSVILLYGVVVLLIGGLLGLLLPPLADQIVNFVFFLPSFWDTATAYLQQHYPEWIETAHHQLANPNVRKLADSIVAEGRTLLSHALPSIKAAFGGVFDVLAFITHVAVIPVYLFFFLLMRGEPTRKLGRHLSYLQPNVRDDVVFLASEFVDILVAFFRGQILIGCCMGALYALGFTLIGLKFGLLIGLLLGLLNIVPYLGTILGLGIALPLGLFQPEGGWHLVGLVLLVKALVQGIESWFLTPRIMGHQTGLHPVAIIFAIFFWGTAFAGILGMLLAVPLTAFFVTVWRLAKRKYFKPAEV